MKTLDNYQPIACSFHSELELAIMKGEQWELILKDSAVGDHPLLITPLDLITRNSEEFLVYQTDMDTHQQQIRLDQIIALKPASK